jgi:hypothetical protein
MHLVQPLNRTVVVPNKPGRNAAAFRLFLRHSAPDLVEFNICSCALIMDTLLY